MSPFDVMESGIGVRDPFAIREKQNRGSILVTALPTEATITTLAEPTGAARVSMLDIPQPVPMVSILAG